MLFPWGSLENQHYDTNHLGLNLLLILDNAEFESYIQLGSANIKPAQYWHTTQKWASYLEMGH